MELLEKLVIPPSENHVLLVKYMLIISLTIFIPYISMLLGASFIATYFNRKGRQTGNRWYLQFARDVIEKLTISRSAELALGAIPAASILFAYAQLLYASKSISISIMALAMVMFIISFAFIYRYRNSFQVIRLLDSVKGIVETGESAANTAKIAISKFEEKMLKSNSLAFNFGKWLLVAAAYLFVGTRALAGNPERWESVGNILQIIFSWQTIFDFLTLLSIAGTVSGAAILFYFFKWPAYSKSTTFAKATVDRSAGRQGVFKDGEEGYQSFVKNFAGSLTLISAISLPVTIFISYLYLPASAQSPAVFFFFLVVLVLVLIVSNFLYTIVKNSNIEPAAVVFGLIIVVLLLNILKDQSALGSAIEPQIIKATKVAEEMEKEVKAKTVSVSGIDAAQIYNTKCIACHKFDQKVVGPPYQQTVPKYNGDVNALSEFIFNPVKKDPAYPPMPNQGLKKKEAQAMAKWLIDQVAGKK